MKKEKLNSIFTIGHSTNTAEQFISLLKAHDIKQLIDIRTIPKSRHNPQFNKDALEKYIRSSGIGYRHMKNLGGLRHSRANSINLGWNNLSFRGFADYMASEEFAQALDSLINLAKKKKTAIMCAEALPWRCHRSLVADALNRKKWKVFHFMSKNTASLHKMTPFLRIQKGKIVYP